MTAMVTNGQFLFGCETARRRSFTVNGLTLNALEWGEPGRPALCFLHGGSAHAHWFDGVAPAFADRYHVVSLDQRGHGASDWSPAAAYATPDFAGDLLGVADALGWERMTLAGHSMGGHNAMAFAAWHPERLSALVIIDSRPSLPADRLDRMHQRGHRGPRRHETLDDGARELPAPAARDGGGARAPRAHGARGHRRARRALHVPVRSAGQWRAPPHRQLAAARAHHRAHPDRARRAFADPARRRWWRTWCGASPTCGSWRFPGCITTSCWTRPEAFTAVLEGFLAEVGKEQ